MRDTEKTTKTGFLVEFFLHLHPRTIPVQTLRFSLSFGLGGMAATLVMLLFVTGLLQLLMYVPGTNGAYASVQQMYHHIPIGGWIRNMHYWASNLLVVVMGCHLLRVFLTGAINADRRLNWVIGLVLLCLVLLANFTGYLLPWDQKAFWAVTIFTGMFSYIPLFGPQLMELLRGGSEVGSVTLANFYAVHTGFFPFLLVLFSAWHFWLVRKSGGLILRETPGGETLPPRVPVVPELISHEAAVGLIVAAVLAVMSALFDAPLGDPANFGQSPNPAKGAWYFAGLQELLLHLHPTIAFCIIPLLAFASLAWLPWIKDAALPGGLWFGGEAKNGRRALISFVSGFMVTVAFVLVDDTMLRSREHGLSADADIWTRGLLPLLLYLAVLFASSWFMRRRGRNHRSVHLLVVLSFHFGLLLALTSLGIWFRGEGMRLIWPL